MIPFYNLADQEIYNRGLSFIPQERFRLADPFFGVTPNASSSPSGLMSIVDRNRAALNQAALRQASPMAFIMGGEQGREDDDIDRTDNLGITSLSDLTGFISTPGIIGGTIAGLPGALIGRTLGQAFDNFNNPYTDIFGRLNKKTKTAIEKDYRDSPEGRAAISAFADIQNQIGRSRHGQEGSGGGPGSGANEGGSGADSGSGTHSDPGD